MASDTHDLMRARPAFDAWWRKADQQALYAKHTHGRMLCQVAWEQAWQEAWESLVFFGERSLATPPEFSGEVLPPGLYRVVRGKLFRIVVGELEAKDGECSRSPNWKHQLHGPHDVARGADQGSCMYCGERLEAKDGE